MSNHIILQTITSRLVLSILGLIAFAALLTSTVFASLPANTHSLDLERDSDQVATYADEADFALDLSNSFTVEAWVKLESLPSNNERYNVVGKSNPSGNQRGYGVGIRNIDGDLDMTIYIYDDGATPATISYSDVVSMEVDTWYHVAFVKNGTSSAFYLDGVDQGTNGTLDASIYNNSSDFVLGAERADGTDGFDGLLDDVRVFNDARTASEIIIDAYTEKVTDGNLVGEWNLENNYNDNTSNGYDLTAGGSPTPSFSSYQAYGGDPDSHSLDVERSDTHIATISDADQSGLDLSSDFTVESWVKFESLPGSNERYNIVGKHEPTGNERAYGVGVRNIGGNYEMTIYIYDDGATPATISYSDALSITTGTWYHLAFVKDGTSSAFYLDGVDQGTNGTLDSSIYNNDSPFALGAERADGTDAFDGLLNNVRVFNDVRTRAEILQGAYTANVIDSNLVGEWNLDGNYTDSSGNSNTLISPLFSTDTQF